MFIRLNSNGEWKRKHSKMTFQKHEIPYSLGDAIDLTKDLRHERMV